MPDLYFDNQLVGTSLYFSNALSSLTPVLAISSAPSSIQAGVQQTLVIRDAAVTPTTLNTLVKFVDTNGPSVVPDQINDTGGGVFEVLFTFPFPVALQFLTNPGYTLLVEVGAESTSVSGVSWEVPAGWAREQALNPITAEGSVFYNYTGSLPVNGQQIVYQIATTGSPSRTVTVLPSGEWQLSGVPDDGGSFDVFVIDGDGSAGATATITFPDYPTGTITIETITPNESGATAVVAYDDVDITGFQYNIDGGSWIATGTTTVITGQANDTTFTFGIRAVNGSILGDPVYQDYTTVNPVDTTPDPFTLNAVTDAQPGTTQTSNPVTVQGVDPGQDVAVSVEAGLVYYINTGSGWSGARTAPGTVRLNHQVRVELDASALFDTTVSRTLTIGGVTADFSVTTVADTVAPVVTATGGNQTIVEGSTWNDPGATATDNADGVIDPQNIVVSGDAVNVNVPGVYTITYSATDSAGNTGQTTRIVTVQPLVSDTTVPVITLLGDQVINHPLNATYTDAGATATDNIDGNITGSIVTTGADFDVNTAGTYFVRYNVADSAGNAAAEVVRTVNVVAASTSYPFRRTADWDGSRTADIVIGDTFRRRVTLSSNGVPFNAFGADVKACIVNNDHSQQLCDVVDITLGTNATGGIMEILIPEATTAQLADEITSETLVKVEIQLEIDSEKYSWFAVARAVPGYIP